MIIYLKFLIYKYYRISLIRLLVCPPSAKSLCFSIVSLFLNEQSVNFVAPTD